MEILPAGAALKLLKSGRTGTNKLAGEPNIPSLQLPSKYLTRDLISTPYNPSYINTFGATPSPPNDKTGKRCHDIRTNFGLT